MDGWEVISHYPTAHLRSALFLLPPRPPCRYRFLRSICSAVMATCIMLYISPTLAAVVLGIVPVLICIAGAYVRMICSDAHLADSKWI